MTRTPSIVRSLSFTRFDVRDNDSLARLFDHFESRTGIYWLVFDNDQVYVGQSTDARRRLADHVRHQPGRIVEVLFAPVLAADLDAVERQLIQELDREGTSLRNKAITRFPAGRAPLELTITDGVTISLPWERELRGRIPAGYDPPPVQGVTDQQRARFAELGALGVYPRVRRLLGEFIDRTMPSPVETEGLLWTLSALPGTNRARGWRRLFTLNVGRIESLRIFERELLPGLRPQYWAYVNVEYRDDPRRLTRLLNRFAMPASLSDTKYAEPARVVELTDARDLVSLLEDDYAADLVYGFHARYMRQGSMLQIRSHNPLFSADVLRAAGHRVGADPSTATADVAFAMSSVNSGGMTTSSRESDSPGYLRGFGNQHVTEAVPGALPVGRNSPQRPPLGLYAEQLSGTAFTQPRATNRRTWAYRIRPSAAHPPFHRIPNGTLRTGPFTDLDPDPNRLRWDPMPLPEPGSAIDFVTGLFTIGGHGSPLTGTGMAVHTYAANASMTDVFVNADGELLIVPESGSLNILTELGQLNIDPGHIALIPRGLRFRVELGRTPARGYVCENYGAAFTLPERGPIGANGLANERDFLAPVARFEDDDAPVRVVQKFGGNLWAADYDHSPLDVVAWHGNLAPYAYDLAHFMVLGSISFDHPDPSIFTVLTSPTTTPGLANVDFVAFAPRWLVGEDTFRPPWFHRNVMAEYMGLIRGVYDAKAEGFRPGGASLHNSWASHGPDAATHRAASTRELTPEKLDDTLAFMFETNLPIITTDQAMEAAHRQQDYDAVWAGLGREFRA